MNNDQRSLNDQLRTLFGLANEHGLYDAADWLKNVLEAQEQRTEERRRWLSPRETSSKTSDKNVQRVHNHGKRDTG